MLTVSEFFDAVYKPERLLGCSPATLEQYWVVIKHFGQTRPLCELTTNEVASMMSDMLDRKAAVATVNKSLRHLRAIASFAYERGYLDYPLKLRPICEYQKAPRAWSVEQVGRLIAQSKKVKGEICDVPARLWWPALLLTLYDTGARIGAAMRLEKADISFEHRRLILSAETQKDRQDVVCRVSIQTVGYLRRLTQLPGNRVFPWPYDKRRPMRYLTLTSHFRRIVVDAGLDAEHGLFHRLRKTRATYGEIAFPGSATGDLGHSARWLTTKYYIDPTLMPGSGVVDKIPRPKF